MSDVDPNRRFYSINLYKYRFLESLSADEKSKFVLLLNTANYKVFHKKYPEFKYVVFSHKDSLVDNIPFLNMVNARNEFRRFVHGTGCDCFFSASNIDYKITSRFDIHKVIVVHDIKSIWEGHGFWGRLVQKIRVSGYYRSLINNSNVAVAISNFTKDNIINSIPRVCTRKIKVIYNSVIVADNPEPIDTHSEKYILYVNTLDEYKNIITLIKAIATLAEENNIVLYIVAAPNEYWNNVVLPFIEQSKMKDRVRIFSNVPDTQLRYLYENASLFVSPSLNEGFGYTPLEAAICKCPVICSQCEALPDTTLGELNYYSDPMDYYELANEIKRVINSKKNEFELDRISQLFEERYSAEKQKNLLLEALKMK